jgi:uncharacterized protein with von Willebrand factor type A (vWA) domain
VREAAALTARLAMLVGSLRAGGVRVGLGELLGAHRALCAVDVMSRRESYFALRAALCSRHDDIEVFDAAFEACFGPDPSELPPEAALAAGRIEVPGPPEPASGDETGSSTPIEVDLDLDLDLDPDAVTAAWSDVELLKEKDFAAYTAEERARARRLVARIGARGPQRRSRRMRTVRRRGEHPDHRATMRASLRYGGEPFDRRWRAPTERPRPLVLVCDVSGSMEPYARMLFQYLHACVSARRRVEAFAFGTRLTRVTRELERRDPDAALAHAAAAVTDWHGGTRIGAALGELNREHGRRLGRGSVVVVLSDGWDRGDPDELRAEMARLARCCHRLVWLNPLKAQPRYEPLTRGMVAALPHVDAFLAGNSIASLEELAELLEEEAG